MKTCLIFTVGCMLASSVKAQTDQSVPLRPEQGDLTPADITAYTKAKVTVAEAPSSIADLAFDFQSSAVNQAMIAAYTNNPSIWKDRNLFIVGICCVREQRYETAKGIFLRLTKEAPESMGSKTAFANAAFLNGDLGEAKEVYSSLWNDRHDVVALKGLGTIAVQEKDVTALRALLPDLIQRKNDDLDIRKILLLYSLMEDDIERGGPVAAAAVRGLKISEVEENADFRKILLMATMKYREAAEQ